MMMTFRPKASGIVVTDPEVIADEFAPIDHDAEPEENDTVNPMDATDGSTPTALNTNN
jgi:hypothetical protein